MIFLVDPEIGILNKIFFLLAIVILRHRPKIEVLVLAVALPRIVSFLFR